LREIILKAPATIANLGPGFDIFALALEIPYDIIKLSLNKTNSINLKISGKVEGIPVSTAENTAGLAASHFLKKINSSQGVNIEIIKNIQSCAGLGTSGASAVSSVYGLNRLLITQFHENEIIDIARKAEKVSGRSAHADNVAACLLGGLVLIKSYKPMDVAKIDVPHIPTVISVIKKVHKTTRGSIPRQMSLARVCEQMSFCSSLIHAIYCGDLKSIGEAVNYDYISEPTRSLFIPDYGELKKTLLDAGAYGCNVSGGGSSVFVICEEAKMEEIADIMKSFFLRSGTENEIILTRASNLGITEINEL
jgi:homoserine kinase